MSSDSYMQEDGKEYARDLKKYFTEVCKKNWWKAHIWKPQHYYMSFFIETSVDKFIYISISEFRSNKCWMDQILYRSAKNLKDFSWWSNQYAQINQIENSLINFIWY